MGLGVGYEEHVPLWDELLCWGSSLHHVHDLAGATIAFLG